MKTSVARIGWLQTEAEYYALSDAIHALSEDKFKELERCPNCRENNPKYIEQWPRTHPRQKVGNFWHRKCLSCGQYFSLLVNFLKTKPAIIDAKSQTVQRGGASSEGRRRTRTCFPDKKEVNV